MHSIKYQSAEKSNPSERGELWRLGLLERLLAHRTGRQEEHKKNSCCDCFSLLYCCVNANRLVYVFLIKACISLWSLDTFPLYGVLTVLFLLIVSLS